MSISRNKVILSKCKPVAEVIYINVELDRVGFTPFQTECNGDPHGNTSAKKKKYLTKKISTSETGGLAAIQQNCGEDTVLWRLDKPEAELEVKIDPFTGLTQEGKDVGFVSATLSIPDNSNCTEDTITNRRSEFNSTYVKCDGTTANRFIDISFSKENTDEELSTNADSLMNHFTIFDTTVIPEYNTFVDVVPGTDGKKSRSGASVSSMPKTKPWRAKYFVDENGINKSQLYVKFLEDTIYTEATGSYNNDGSVSDDYNPLAQGTVKTASSGQFITVEPPTEKNTFIEIHACQHLTVCERPDCNISVKTTDADETIKAREEINCENCTGNFGGGCGASQIPDCPCACVYTDGARFLGTNGKRYARKKVSHSSSSEVNVTVNTDVVDTVLMLGGCSDVDENGNHTENPDLDTHIETTFSGSTEYSGTESFSSSSESITCSDDPDPESDSSDPIEASGDLTVTEVYTDRNEEDGECVDSVSTDSGTADPGVSVGGTSLYALALGGDVSICAEDDEKLVTVSTEYPGTFQSEPNEGTISHTVEATGSSITATSVMTVDVSKPVADVTYGSENSSHTVYDITASGSVTGEATRSIVLSDPVDSDSNYTVTLVPNTSVPEDDPAYDDGVRDGALTESIDYSGGRRSHVDLKEVTFDVTTIPSSGLKKSLEHRSYLNYLISKLDKSDETKTVLSHETKTEFVDERCNNPENESDQWTVEKKLPVSIDLGDVDGNTATISRVSCFVKVDFESEDSCS